MAVDRGFPKSHFAKIKLTNLPWESACWNKGRIFVSKYFCR